MGEIFLARFNSVIRQLHARTLRTLRSEAWHTLNPWSARKLSAGRAVTYPKSFGVGIRARIRSSSSPVTRLMPLLRQDSSTALTTMPRTNAGIFFMRASAAPSHAIVAGYSRAYWIVGAQSAAGADARPRMASRGDPADLPGVWVLCVS